MPNDNINGALTPRVTINGVLRERQRINGNMREGGGTSNYEELENLPAFNNIVIEGNQDPNYYGIAKLTDIPNINYSTNEINTGVKWIDGKDIFCRTFTAPQALLLCPVRRHTKAVRFLPHSPIWSVAGRGILCRTAG